jgi:hypothetical protein
MLFSYAIEGFLGWLSRFKGIGGWVGGGMGGGVDAYICIACLLQGFCIRKTR